MTQRRNELFIFFFTPFVTKCAYLFIIFIPPSCLPYIFQILAFCLAFLLTMWHLLIMITSKLPSLMNSHLTIGSSESLRSLSLP